MSSADERKIRQDSLISKFEKELSERELKTLAIDEISFLENQKFGFEGIKITTLSSQISELRTRLKNKLPSDLITLHNELNEERRSMIRVLNSLHLPIAEHKIELRRIQYFPCVIKIKEKIKLAYKTQDIKTKNIERFLEYFTVPDYVRDALRQRNLENINRDLSDLKNINTNTYLETCIKLLQSRLYYERVSGLIGATGRRPTEIVKTASFKESEKNHLLFFGQLKTKNSHHADEGINIPVLVETDLILDVFTKIRSEKSFEMKTETATNNIVNSSINRNIRKHFGEIFPVATKLSAKTLKRTYRTISIKRFCPKNVDPIIYGNYILGHAESSLDVQFNYGGISID